MRFGIAEICISQVGAIDIQCRQIHAAEVHPSKRTVTLGATRSTANETQILKSFGLGCPFVLKSFGLGCPFVFELLCSVG